MTSLDEPESAVVVSEISGQIVTGRGEARLLELSSQGCGRIAVGGVGDHHARAQALAWSAMMRPSCRTRTRSRSAVTSTTRPIARGSTE